ncbi:hypothetical protein [Natrinema versiforme]|uniref:Uncharacterized protein n=1 Tax=Natrinema versiforme TaxID=88724 RepID=A0A4P8WIZ3_9EURY|nr:hypothetical protein [Natrinema versiforme]QCS43410.1 hypothetical protein FEJ81_14005 [Natrinema versiforme]
MNWIPVVGLVLGIVGSGLVILPTFPSLKPCFVNQEKIEVLKSGRVKLSRQGQLTVEDPSFELIYKIIEKELGRELLQNNDTSCQGFHTSEINFSLEGGEDLADRGSIVYAIDSAGVEALKAEELKNPITEGESEKVGPIQVIDIWINEEANRLEEDPIQRWRGIGFFLIVLSTFVQSEFVSSLIPVL